MPLTHCLLALFVVLCWGLNFIAIEAALQEIPPIFLCFARFFLTSLPAVFFFKFPATSFKKVLWYGWIMFAVQFALLFIGMNKGVTPGLASLLVQTQAFFTILFAVIVWKEKLHRWQVIGALLAFSGIALVGISRGGSVTLLGFIFVIASAMCFAAGNLISKKMGQIDRVALVVWASLIAWPPLLITSLLLEGPQQILLSLHNLTWSGIGSVLYIAYLSTFIGFAIWSWLLHQHPLPTVAPFTLLVPIVAIGSSVWILGEPLQSWKVAAGVLVITGLCINLLGPKLFKKR